MSFIPALPVAVAAGAIGCVDPAWAPAANTALIIVLAAFHARNSRQARDAERRALEAQAAARDAKRAAGANRRDTVPCPDTGERRRLTDKDDA